jgi:restriction system protein
VARRKSSFIEDVMEVGMKLPWWVSLISALVFYLVLHHYSQIDISPATGPGDVGASVISSIVRAGSSIGQYLIPGLLISGMLVGLIKKVLRKRTYDAVVADTSGDKLDDLNWEQFEEIVHQYFHERDFKVTDTNKGPDGGVDLRLSKNGRAATVQCKHWHSKKVGVSVVREQFGIMTAENADK